MFVSLIFVETNLLRRRRISNVSVKRQLFVVPWKHATTRAISVQGKKIHILRVLETPFVTNRQINTFQSTDWLTP